ncbi:MAG: alpha-E domain-containing protein, partial [Chloroflexi bacterium]|nr:alpha-E domain-containing protein [Chloroflexota bacterium]
MIQMMAEPRSMSVAKDNWLTDSRAYNLIWLGRWMERAESIARGMDTAAK